MRVPLSHRMEIALGSDASSGRDEASTGSGAARNGGPHVIELRGLVEDDLPALRKALKGNAEHLAPWTPKAPRGAIVPWSLVEAARTIARHRREWEEDRGYTFFAFAGSALVGKIAINSIVRGAMEGAYVGYWVAADWQGIGLATALVREASRFGFRVAELHRLQAAVMPRNPGSLRVLAKNGFREEGLAQRYLQIAGIWEDHILFAKTVEEA